MMSVVEGISQVCGLVFVVSWWVGSGATLWHGCVKS